jgi:hypothetical protein
MAGQVCAHRSHYLIHSPSWWGWVCCTALSRREPYLSGVDWHTVAAAPLQVTETAAAAVGRAWAQRRSRRWALAAAAEDDGGGAPLTAADRPPPIGPGGGGGGGISSTGGDGPSAPSALVTDASRYRAGPLKGTRHFISPTSPTSPSTAEELGAAVADGEQPEPESNSGHQPPPWLLIVDEADHLPLELLQALVADAGRA